MYQDREQTPRYVRRKQSRRSTSMMMFVIAGVLLVAGGVVGTPWLSSLFGESAAISSANEAGIVCPNTLVGLTLISEGEVDNRGDVFALECEYVLTPSTEVSANIVVVWTENGPVESLQRGCGLPPSTTPGVFTETGTHYGAIGQSRADYEGQTRYANAMRKLASDLAAAAASVSEPCPAQSVITSPDNSGGSSGSTIGGSPSPSSNSGAGTGSSGSGASNAGGTTSSEGTSSGGGGSFGDGSSSSDSGQPTPEIFGTPVVAANIPAGQCVVRGRVTDSHGLAVPLVRLEIRDASDSLVAFTSTQASGLYGFTAPVDASGEVVLVPTDGGRETSVFRIFAEQSAVTLSRALNASQIESGLCEVDFDLWSLDDSYLASDLVLERWPSIIELYQNFNNAAELATRVGAPLEYGLPVPIYAWCDSSTLFCDPAGVAEFAFYSGSTLGRTVEKPYIAMGFPTSEIGYRGTPDNREYHEFGHLFLADIFNNEVPVNVGDQNHGGYYRNEMTTDSFVEGFAEFYSVMVSKHVDGDTSAERYRIGAEYDIEADRKPWEAVGWWEEFTLAGLLLDFEDGPEDYVNGADGLGVEAVSALTAQNGNFAIGRVRNTGAGIVRNSEVTVSLLNSDGETVFTQVTAVKPDSLTPGQTGVFYVAAPEGVEFSDVDAVAGRPSGTDDDEINLGLSDLLKVISSNWGAGDTQVANVLQLYDVLSAAYAGADVDGDRIPDITQDQIDAIFVKHGFFDDLNGDRVWTPEEDGSIGGTAHPAARVGTNDFAEIMPRASAVGFAGSYVAVDSGEVAAEVLVQVELADSDMSYAYWTSNGTMNPVELAVPEASEDGAAVTVITTADGYEPSVAYRTSAMQFHSAIEEGTITTGPVISPVQMREGDPFASLKSPDDGGSGGSSRAGAPPWSMMLPIVLALLMLIGGVYVMRKAGTN